MAKKNKKQKPSVRTSPEPKEPTPTPKLTPKPSTLYPLLFPFIPIAAALFAFWGAVSNGFVFFDDDKAILYNPALLEPSLSNFFSGQNLGMYAPLSWIAYWIGTLISGQEAWGHHLLGVVLHAVNALLVYTFLNRLTGRPYPALFAATLFAVHPMQTEAVAWAAALSTVLFSFFYLLSLNCYVLSVESQKLKTESQNQQITASPNHRITFYALSFLFFLAACLSKSAAVTLPLLLVAIDIYAYKKEARNFWMSKIPFFLISLAFGLYTFSTRAQEGHDFELASAGFSMLDRVWMVAQTIWFYPYKLLLPFGFSIAYPFVKTGGSWPLPYYLALPALGLAAWLVWRYWRNRPNLLLGLALYLLPLSIMLPFRTVGSFELRSDRYVYLSCLGLFFIAGIFVQRLQKEIQWAVLGVLAVGLSLLSWQQSAVWNNGVALFENCVDKTPKAALCQCNLAYNELITLDFTNSIEHYSNTLDLDSTYIEAYNGRGQAYLFTNQFPQALSDFNNAIRYGLESPKLYMNQGKSMVMTGDFQSAIPALTRSLELEPQNPEAYFFRARAQQNIGETEKALADFAKALEQKPDYPEVLEMRAQMHMQSGDLGEAIADLDRILQGNPQNFAIMSNRGYARLLAGQPNEALADLNQALKINPQFVPAYRVRAAVYQQLGLQAEAQADLQRAQQLAGK